MKNISDLKKRIKPGLKIKLIATNMQGHKYLNIARTITRTQTNGFYAATDEQVKQGQRGSFCDYPKASNFECGGNSFRIIDGEKEYRDYELLEA